jgi:hypothetical protein
MRFLHIEAWLPNHIELSHPSGSMVFSLQSIEMLVLPLAWVGNWLAASNSTFKLNRASRRWSAINRTRSPEFAERGEGMLNRNIMGILGGTTAAGIVWMRWWRNHRRRTLTSRLRRMRAGTMLVMAGITTRWKGIRVLSRKVGKNLIQKSFAIWQGAADASAFLQTAKP